MRIVLDSNVIIASFATEGICHALFELCIDQHEIIISDQILTEVENNLKLKLKLPQQIISEIINYIDEVTIKEHPPKLQKKISRDTSDDLILSLAEISNSEFIITGDKDLLALKRYKSTRIIKPREFWEILRNIG
jgi:putative PIN family toxin of toxin-antitoxin system